ncbi:MAG: integrase family protein [Rhodoferax sp.]|jgi:integrase|nr:integrase family protein [Rhodoferax sp.]
MARPSKSASIDYTAAHELTHGLLERATCPADTAFVLVRDADKKGLRLRVTKAGGKHWQFETRIKGKLFTRGLGEWPAVSIDSAKNEAHRLRGLTESGTDPRDIERQQEADKAKAIADKTAADAAQVQQDAAQALTVGEVWQTYIDERRPHWGELHYRDHIRKAQAGGEPFKRGTGTTEAGPLHPLMALPLCELTAPVIEAWAAKEAQTRPTSARLAWRCLKVFLGWCAEQPKYADLMPAKNQAKTKKARESLGKAGAKSDSLQREQLPVWFAAVRDIQNPVISAYMQTLLLTGARPGEVIAMRWEDVNTQWRGINIKDKVEGERVVPLTAYVQHLLAGLPKRNEWVFSSASSKAGHITEPNHPHSIACKVAGLDGLTLHGLRRSFKSLTEWLEIPAGVVAQLMGHKPSATAEKHYTVRPLDLLRVHHEKIEAWILEQAGVQFDRSAEPGKLRVAA